MRRFPLAVLLPVLWACGETVEPPLDRVRTLMYHRQDTGENYLINSDGTGGRRLEGAPAGLLPLAQSPGDDEVLYLQDAALVVGRISNPGLLDTLLVLSGGSVSLGTFSPADQYLAVVQYGTEARLLVISRAGAVDTIPLEAAPVLPPVFRPDGAQIALVSQTDLSIQVSIVDVATAQVTSHQVAFSRFTYPLLFGWPHWTDEGLLLGTLRRGQAWDTVAVLALSGADPTRIPDVLFTALAPVLTYDDLSTYALSPEADAIALAAVPPLVGGRAIYFAPRGEPLVRVLDGGDDTRPALPVILP